MAKLENQFLKDKYWGKPEFREQVKKSVETQKRPSPEGGFDMPRKPHEQIPHYLERIEKVAKKTDKTTGERGRLFLEKAIVPKYIIKSENISDEYIKGVHFGNFAERKGYESDDINTPEVKQYLLKQFQQETGKTFESYKVPEDEKEDIISMVITDQRSRMENWYDYLTSSETKEISPAFRYWAFAEILKLGSYNDKSKTYNERTETTAASFPELDQQALAKVFDEVKRKREGEPSKVKLSDEEAQKDFKKRLQSENFNQLYSFALEYVNSLRLPTERLPIIEGEWRHFPKGSSPDDLTSSLEGFNTKWCIAGEGFAQSYLDKSDIRIYFSQDVDGQNSIPRACIVDSGEAGITEVRGIMFDEKGKQHLDDYINPVVDEKLKEIPGGEKWKNTMEDMKTLARIHLKHIQEEPLDKDALIFLYEIDKPIQSSGYQQDPRIAELRKSRNPEEDMPIVFDCTRGQIAGTPNEINEDTKAYVGPLEPGIFQKLPDNLEHVYTKFPEKKIRKVDIEIGGKTKDQLTSKILSLNNKIWDTSEYMMEQPEFVTGKERENITLIRLTVADLGFDRVATTDQIYARAQELGLELCPPDTGPNYRIQYQDQPLGEWIYIGMKQIAASDGLPYVFYLGHDDVGLWLDCDWAGPGGGWAPDGMFAFRLRKSGS